jgi:hypothetical protein
VFRAIQHRWEPMSESHLVLESTNKNINEMLEKAVHYLNKEHDKRTNQ